MEQKKTIVNNRKDLWLSSLSALPKLFEGQCEYHLQLHMIMLGMIYAANSIDVRPQAQSLALHIVNMVLRSLM